MKKVHFILAVALLTASPYGYSQSKLVDSLKSALAVSTDENRYDVLWGLAYELHDLDNSQAVTYAEEAYTIALRRADTTKIIKSGRILSQLLRKMDKVQASLDILVYILPVATRHRIESEIRMILNGLALGYTMKGEYDKSLQYNFESLAIRERAGDKAQISVALNNIGSVYSHMEMAEQALHYFLRCLALKDEVNDKYDYDRLLVNIGLSYMTLGNYEKSKSYFEAALKYCAQSCSNQILAEAYQGFGDVYFREGKYAKARRYALSCLDVARKANSQYYQLIAYEQLASISTKMSNLNEAKRFLDLAESLPEKNQYPRRRLYLAKIYAEYYAKLNNYNQAYAYEKKYSDLNTEIFVGKVNSNMANSQIQFFEREFKEKIETQERVMSLQEDAIERQQLLNALAGIVATLTIGLAAVLFYLYKQSKRVNEKLDLRVRERTEELEANRDLLLHARDRQQIILSRVVGDLTSALGTLKGLVTIATNDLPEDKARYFKELEATVGQLTDSVKSIVQV